MALLLRAHSEQHWLSREVIPVVRQLETGERLPAEQLPAAIAYLEVIWMEALGRARETDAELHNLDAPHLDRCPLVAKARRYHASVRTLREAVARCVAPLLAATAQIPPKEVRPSGPGRTSPPGKRAGLQGLIR
jgi:hypothetical protein